MLTEGESIRPIEGMHTHRISFPRIDLVGLLCLYSPSLDRGVLASVRPGGVKEGSNGCKNASFERWRVDRQGWRDVRLEEFSSTTVFVAWPAAEGAS